MNKNRKTLLYNIMSTWGVGICLIVATLSGVLYAFKVQEQDSSIFYDIHKRFLMSDPLVITPAYLMRLLWRDFQKIGLVWLFSSFGWTMPLAIALFFLNVFSYSFTLTVFLLLYQLKGIVVACLLYGVQAITIIYMMSCCIRKKTMSSQLNEVVLIRKYNFMNRILISSMVLCVFNILATFNINGLKLLIL